MLAKKRHLGFASTDLNSRMSDLLNALKKMRGALNSKITLTIKREGFDKLLVIPMLRRVIHLQVVKQRMKPDNIGYVQLSEFTEHVNSALKFAVKSLRRQAGGKLKALVLDLRDNPGGLLDQAVAVSGDFIEHGEVVSTRRGTMPTTTGG